MEMEEVLHSMSVGREAEARRAGAACLVEGKGRVEADRRGCLHLG